ncbi:MAG: hypothetical protein WD226_14030 [Planctomycetota bacterium]
MFRTVLIVLLGVALIYGAFFLEPSEKRFDADAEVAHLTERCEAFKQRRFAGEWLEIYQEFLVPEHRALMSPQEFLGLYDSNLLRPLAMETLDIKIDEEARNALVTFAFTGELVAENLPGNFRKGFKRPENPEDLRQTSEYSDLWTWQEGEWYWPLPKQEVDVLKKSRTGDGKVVLGGGR